MQTSVGRAGLDMLFIGLVNYWQRRATTEQCCTAVKAEASASHDHPSVQAMPCQTLAANPRGDHWSILWRTLLSNPSRLVGSRVVPFHGSIHQARAQLVYRHAAVRNLSLARDYVLCFEANRRVLFKACRRSSQWSYDRTKCSQASPPV